MCDGICVSFFASETERLPQMTYLRYPLQSYDCEALGRTVKRDLTVMLSCSYPLPLRIVWPGSYQVPAINSYSVVHKKEKINIVGSDSVVETGSNRIGCICAVL